ncbi:ArsR/SmtB family transcription factor [Brachybacterium aquaticum]|uniref:DNA-binding transcriptional ArsR family regulator n=1 Tax=Brachybacterium aquaticum TaxID=1432564 RepID=A0A841AGD8_9MICO|nr:metalloregulator ArsR/SmtB family transcription factor [Brachybacterium aquaticum]MBB5832661.1 DNA-binding transcriptional ArsR family regulator [Brachybacterium aquaticum]
MPPAEDPLSRVFHALADPTRRAIIERLAEGPVPAGQLAEPFAISRPAISQHLKVLEEAGLITRTAQARWRLCTLTPEPLEAATDWVERHRAVWSDRFDALDDVLRSARGEQTGENP